MIAGGKVDGCFVPTFAVLDVDFDGALDKVVSGCDYHLWLQTSQGPAAHSEVSTDRLEGAAEITRMLQDIVRNRVATYRVDHPIASALDFLPDAVFNLFEVPAPPPNASNNAKPMPAQKLGIVRFQSIYGSARANLLAPSFAIGDTVRISGVHKPGKITELIYDVDIEAGRLVQSAVRVHIGGATGLDEIVALSALKSL